MSEKREKMVRRIARNQYKFFYSVWVRTEPPKWRIFRHKKWKKKKPVYEDSEKRIKAIAKKRN